MKLKIQSLPLVGLSTLLGLSAHGATSVTYDFESESTNDLFAGEVLGWTQDSINPSAFGTIFPLAYIATTNFGGGGTNSGHLGTQFGNTPDNSSTTVTGNLDFAGIDVAAPRVTLNLAILDNNADSFSGRDGFSFDVRSNSNASMAQITFTPTVGNDTTWNVAVGINGAAPVSTAATVQSLSGYFFAIDFGSSATSFSYGSSQGGVANVNFGNLSPIGVGNMGGVSMTHNPLAPAGDSATTIVFDNIVASIPEPSGAALLLLGSAFLMGRRRP
ncbi:PEP-CTERM sorting domain-containing protein [Akkermansiaceae bacterium]|nr:PEP-CTERM sorting domain-containing protein [Akkermansiaceae bacterium]